MRALFVLLALIVAGPAQAAFFQGQAYAPPGAVLPSFNDTSANWVNAGLLSVGGIPVRSTQCGATVSPSGLTPPTSGDDAALITAAIAACPTGDVVQLGAGAFQVAQSELPILLNKSITLRGTGNCTQSSTTTNPLAQFCQTVINVRDGALPDWSVSSTTAGVICGVSTGSLVACSQASGVILMSPSGNFDWGWGGCNLGTTPTSCGATLAADVAKGDTTVQVSNTASFSVGMWVLIDEDPRPVATANPTGGASLSATSDFLSSSGSPSTMRLAIIDAVNTYSMAPSRLDQELHKVLAIGPGPCPGVNCTLTFDDPLTMAYRQSGSHDARVFWPTVQGTTANPFLQNAGVENLGISKAANSAITLTFCAQCWVKNVECGGWIAGCVNVEWSARDAVTHNYFHDCYDCENNGAEYPVGIDSASTEVLVDDNIIVRGGKGMVGRGANTAVVSYNYVDDTFYMQSVIGDYWRDMVVNGSHFGGTHHFLFEGNWGADCDGDETHGNAIYHLCYPNDCTGIRTTFVDPSQGKTVNDSIDQAWGSGGGASPPATPPGPLRAGGPMAYNYWYAFVGNVMGLGGVTTTANGWVYQCAFVGGGTNVGQGNKCIWMPGWVGGEWPNADSNMPARGGTYMFRHGDYDYVNGSIVDWTSGFSHTLPSSFYLASSPSYFGASGANCVYPWPWVTPTAGSPLQSPSGAGCALSAQGDALPAKARFDAGTPFVQP